MNYVFTAALSLVNFRVELELSHQVDFHQDLYYFWIFFFLSLFLIKNERFGEDV